jgi:protoheme IX farnesyltransferase
MPSKDYLYLLKLKQTSLLLFTAIAAYYAAPGHFSLWVLSLLLVSEFLAIGGTTAVNMYFDRDIDAKMNRTKWRPLPAGRIKHSYALIYGSMIYAAGLVLSINVNWLLFLTILLGFVFDIFVYTLYFKRRTFLNVIFGGMAGGMPAMGGWLAKTGFFEPGAVLAFALVFLWIPMHIWFLSIYYLDDYRASGVPMLPVVVGERRTAKYVIATLFLLEMVVVVMYLLNYANIFTLSASTVLTLLSIRVMVRFIKEPSREIARQLFKFASPYLAFVFLFMVFERAFNLL